MCSIEQRIAEIGRAIDDLAVKTGQPAAGDDSAADAETVAGAIDPDDPSRIVARLAELWGLLAELDPEVARRLAGYQALLSPATPNITGKVRRGQRHNELSPC
jgi:hypothetical protein